MYNRRNVSALFFMSVDCVGKRWTFLMVNVGSK